ncbi:RHO1 GDP-GTP exchange protein 2, partial [Ceratobasidium sp. 423]
EPSRPQDKSALPDIVASVGEQERKRQHAINGVASMGPNTGVEAIRGPVEGGNIGQGGRTYTTSTGNVPLGQVHSNSTSAGAARSPHPDPRPQQHTSHNRSLVHPALLSRVANEFRQRIHLTNYYSAQKYSAAFLGSEAVSLITNIIKTSDRILALQLGRALHAQKFFHDPKYNRRLRDSPNALYQFSGPYQVAPSQVKRGKVREPSGTPLPSGVFTRLTDCYSPTCNKNRGCYCYSCPRRVQRAVQKRPSRPFIPPYAPGNQFWPFGGTTTAIGVTPALARRPPSMESLSDRGVGVPDQLWINLVPPEIVESVSEQEKKRQEAINEVINAEYNFVQDLEYLRDLWMEPLRTGDIIPPDRRSEFMQQVFGNVKDILDVSKQLSDLLTECQDTHLIVPYISDLFLTMVPRFHPFVQYSKHQLDREREFEREISTNPAFAAFVKRVERLPESRKLELSVYLMKPITHLARYLLMLEVVLKYTPEDNMDRDGIPRVVEMVREFLAEADEERSRTENRLKLLQLDEGLIFRPGEEIDLGLTDEQRELVHYGSLEHRGTAEQSIDLQVFLLDHILLIVTSKLVRERERFEVFKQPIPLGLLIVSMLDEAVGQAPRSHTLGDSPLRSDGQTASSQPSRDSRSLNGTSLPAALTSQMSGYPLVIQRLGRNGYILTLWASTAVTRNQWVEKITTRQDAIREQNTISNTYTLNKGFFLDETRVNCAVSYDNGRRLAYGTNNGVYFQSLYNGRTREPKKKLNLVDVQQIDILEDYRMFIILAEQSILVVPLNAIGTDDPMEHVKRITSGTSFYAGYCLDRTLVCVVKAGSLGTMIKIFELTGQFVRGESKLASKKLKGNITLKVFGEFHIPGEVYSINFLQTNLCVVCTSGFEIVNLETLEIQELLNPADASLDSMRHLGDVRPLSADFAFYVNKDGWWSKEDVVIHWEGTPSAFALHYPYIIAIGPMFVEIRHVEDGALVRVIQGNNFRLLFANTQPSVRNSTVSADSIVYTRAEIILASDDKVMTVRLASSPSHSLDGAVVTHLGMAAHHATTG